MKFSLYSLNIFKIGLFVFGLLLSKSTYSQCNELFISEYVEGSGNDKAIEIYNPTSNPINLSTYNIRRYSNGSIDYATGGITNLVGIIQPLSTFVLVNGQTTSTSNSPACSLELQALADQLDGAFPSPTYCNGNDAVVLAKGNVIIDILGKIGEDPGTAWSSLFPHTANSGVWITWNHTMIRKSAVQTGVSFNPDFFDPLAQYDTLPNNTWSNLGIHTCICQQLATSLGSISNNGQESNNPNPITFTSNPTGCSSFTYQWYSTSGVVSAPTGSSTSGWTLIPGATSNTYDPPTLFSSTSFACYVTPLSACGSSGWASGVASYTITTSLGTITGNGFSSNNDPAALSFSSISSGCPSFTYQWYSISGVVSAPTGSSTIGWTLIPGATSNTYDPPTLYSSTSYACFVTPLSTCGNAAWAGGVASFTITTWQGTVNEQQVSQCSANAVPLSFTEQPVGFGNATFQWYVANGTVACPQGNATSGWTAIAGATSSASSFIPPSSGTYTLACLVTPEGITGLPTQWANGCKTVVVNSFTAQSIIGNPSIIPFTPYLYLVSQVIGHTYSWTAYGGAISSGQGTNQVNVVWAATGPYQLMLIENNGECSDTSYLDAENSTITQINEAENTFSNVQVFPNPTDVGFTIQSNAILAGESIELLDQVGRVVLQTNAAVNSTYVSTAHLSKGIYFLRMPIHPGYSRKLIVN